MRGMTQQPPKRQRTGTGKPFRLVNKLFDGKIDIIGDVHGEAGALTTLLDRLGYDGRGNHPEGRKLVFVGDLVDRGPNSVAVVDLVKSFVHAGNAQMVLGNHELNILRGKRKHGNHWFYGKPEVIRKDRGGISFQVLAPSDSWRESTLAFFREQPLILERKDLTVVHAAIVDSSLGQLKAWDEESLRREKESTGGKAIQSLNSKKQQRNSKKQNKEIALQPRGVVAAFEHFKLKTEEKIKKLMASSSEEQDSIETKIALSLIDQNENPVKVASSGLEKKAKEKYFAGGKWRVVEREQWWENYKGEAMVVIGHYWRRFAPPNPKLVEGFTPSGENPFRGVGDFAVAGGGGGVMCVDYSVGIRYEERGKGWSPGSMGTGLAAFRLPESVLYFDDGRTEKVVQKH